MKNLLNVQSVWIIFKFQMMDIHVSLKIVMIGLYLMSILINFNKLNVLIALMDLVIGKLLKDVNHVKTISH